MDNERELRLQKYNELLSLKAGVEKDLLNIPGVAAVSVGIKATGGLLTQDMCFRVYVDKKKPEAEISDTERIPALIHNIQTDVNEIPKNVTGSGVINYDYNEYRPLCGGISIRTAKSSYAGTLGCFVEDNSDDMTGEIFLLTNYHVLMSQGEEKGHQVGQPDFCCDRCCCRCGEIAKIERWGDWQNDNVDCAIAILTNGQENNWNNEVFGLGAIRSIRLDPVTGVPLHPRTGLPTFNGSPYRPVIPNDTVFKSGMTTGQTEGIVVDPSVPVTVNFHTKNGLVPKLFLNQILIYPKFADKPFVSKGDSGSVVLNHLNEVVGLHFADDEERNSDNKVVSFATQSYANPIQDVLKILQVRIPETGTYPTLPLKSTGNETSPQRKDTLAVLSSRIESQPDGALLINTFKKHRKEVMDLINTDREVKVAWNRYQGPAFTAHIMEKAKDPAYKLPTEIENVSYQRLLSKMSVVLEKNGSPEMAKDIEKYSAKAFGLIEKFIE